MLNSIITLCIIFLFVIGYWYNNKDKRPYLLSKYIPPGSTVLDIGTGDGYNAREISKKCRVTSIDIVNEGIYWKPLIYNGKKLPFKNSSFDYVTCSFILHHAPNHMDLLKEIRRVCKKGVVIFENTPENKMQRYFTQKHENQSIWQRCTGCMKSIESWLDVWKQLGFKIHKIEKFPWYFEFPFASPAPYFYPVTNTLFVLGK